ncbi:EscU/YscU/HrcU family type III secretion system export apparatus switch protein [Niameybacter massiliensis]|uniref:EscU/YscU/HrcU family type III secretion system export apparatus switch protein n=1 Tax=Holtiella tumoricola TaxID=3018743 RepID=A0AA42DP87_9FIRM|nr:EscU/YscU/HrcU family type III secretion system export apparatus switch protein [Holtiella tumoricola]MDA3732552.1 EscU/YscU/HrcU family type III secretion system export apparatus switch protein [Holtiella tumoricola]
MEDKIKRAAAISYDPEKASAPIVVAEGKGYVAKNIIEEAKKQNIPVYKDDKLATLLTEIKIGAQIPEELYDIMAQILVFVSDMDELYGKVSKE